MANKRMEPIDFEFLSDFFNAGGGYYDLGNRELAHILADWQLTGEDNRNNPEIVAHFLKWSFTISFLHMVNSIQWLFSGVLLDRSSYFPAQVIQLYYYSIFFSYGGFLAVHGKGHFTIDYQIPLPSKKKNMFEKITYCMGWEFLLSDKVYFEDKVTEENLNLADFLEQLDQPKAQGKAPKKPQAIRREIWFDYDQEGDTFIPYISWKDKRVSSEHRNRAKWFYSVFRRWEDREDYPDVLFFKQSQDFHSNLRNMFTYSLADIAEELYSYPHDRSETLTNEVLLELWHGSDLANYFPEAFWALGHLKVLVDSHVKFLESYDKDKTPYASTQIRLIEGLLDHHKITGMESLIREILKPIIEKMGL